MCCFRVCIRRAAGEPSIGKAAVKNRLFRRGGKVRELLGGKGANLAEMNLIGIPVPPGFTITTEVCSEYYAQGREKVVELLRPAMCGTK